MPVAWGSARWAVVTLRLVYLIFLRLTSWAALLARSDTSKDAEILVLPPTDRAGRQVARPRPSWADRAIISTPSRTRTTLSRIQRPAHDPAQLAQAVAG